MSSWTRDGPSSTSTRTASVSHRPAPAARVSARWRSVESSSPPSTAATPPWAHRVADWDSSALVSTPTRSPACRPRPARRRGPGARPAGRRPTGRPPRCPGPGRRGAGPASTPPPVSGAGGRTQRSVEARLRAGDGEGPSRGSRLSISRTGPTVAAMSSRRGRAATGAGRLEVVGVDHGGVVQGHRGLRGDHPGHLRLHRRRAVSPPATRAAPDRRAPGQGQGGPALARPTAGRSCWTGPGRRGGARWGTRPPRWAGERSRTTRRTRASCWKSFSPK